MGAPHINSSSVSPEKKHKEYRALLSTLRFLNINFCVLDICLACNCMNWNMAFGIQTQYVDIVFMKRPVHSYT